MMDEMDEKGGCCLGPAAMQQAAYDRHAARLEKVPEADSATRAGLTKPLVPIPGGFFEMGARQSHYPQDFEGPRRKVFVSPFRIAATAVTNEAFARFVEATGYQTAAEVEGWSYVFHQFLEDPAHHPNAPPQTPWWRQVHGASWSAPEGPGSSIAHRMDHPAVHVSWFDAQAYCRWAGVRLAYEAEWEKAARGGLERKKFPWGNELAPGGVHLSNTWQGRFPIENSLDDGYAGTAPVTAFEPNGFGLHNMTGNVWEWCMDWFGDMTKPTRRPRRDPIGPDTGETRVLRGGSYLCHESYCIRYHVYSRMGNTPDTSSGNMGFRIALPGS